MTDVQPAELARLFQLQSISEDSMSPWASVYRASTSDDQTVVVKRTGSTEQRATAMSKGTRAVRATGVNVVTPVELPQPNPQKVGDAWWVVYPFVPGDGYNADPQQLEAAGRLLAEIHAAPLNPTILNELRAYSWPNTVRDDVDTDLATLAERMETHLGHKSGQAMAALCSLGERWWSTSLPDLLAAERIEPLPRAGVSSDYKANNLVFTDSDATLIDPDNGGLEPRIFDLAMAVVLFHTESADAPGRLFNNDEWDVFASSYLARIDLTPRERELWAAALDHMLWEEGTWMLEDSGPRDWSDRRQASYLADLAIADPSRYPLP